MCTVFNILFGLCLLICHFDACFSNQREETKKKLDKIIESGELVNAEFSISKEILGEGQVGVIYKGKRLKGDKIDVAIKIEDCDSRMRHIIGIGVERNNYLKLGACANEASFNKNLTGIPTVYYYGKYHNDTYDVMVMTMIKNTIGNEFKRLGSLSRETVFMIAIQMIERLKYIHERGFIVQDVHANNMGHKDDVIYIFDLNLAKLKGSTKFGKFPVGPPACRSASADKGIIEEKDDMIALGFSLCVLYGKELSLPWMTKAFKNPKSNFVRTMLEIKEKTVVKDWLKSTNCTDAAIFIDFFGHLDTIQPNKTINYSFLKGLFVKALAGKVKHVFDWMKK